MISTVPRVRLSRAATERPLSPAARAAVSHDIARRDRPAASALLRQLFYSCLTSGLIAGAAVLIATLHTTQDRPHHKWLTMEDTVYCRGPVL